MNEARQLRHNLLGDITAEGDRALLDAAFIETPEYRSLLETTDRTVVVGRRGTGKSAMFLRLADHWPKDNRTVVLQFAPEDYQVIGFRDALLPFSIKFTYAKAVTKILWRYALIVEISRILNKRQTGPSIEPMPAVLAAHVAAWGEGHTDLMGSLRNKMRAIAKSTSSPEESIGDLPTSLDLGQLEREFNDYLKAVRGGALVLIDRLDEGYEPDNVGIGTVAGVVTAVSELRNL